jgi:formiminotetrahydrofolate cyclodeaminase
MDWNNIDLKNDYECSREILTGYRFETLLMEISCNLREINKETVKKQFETELNNRIREAREIFEANLSNIVKEAQRYRAIE